MSVRKNSSAIWHHFEKDSKTFKGTCNVCNEMLSYKSSTANLKSHLRRRHPSIYMLAFGTEEQSNHSSPICKEEVLDWEIEPIPDASTSLAEKRPLFTPVVAPPKRPKSTDEIENETISFEQKMLIDKDLLDLCIDSFHPFSIVEEPSFKKFCRWIPGYTLPTRKILSGFLLRQRFDKAEADVKTQLAREVQTICVTTDRWTSRVGENYVAITGHYITEELEFRTVLLGCCNFSGNPTAVNISTEIGQILNKWQLKEKVNFAITDNDAKIVMAIKGHLAINHFGCFACTLNLIVEEALLPTHEVLIEKINKIVSYFKRSTVLSERLATYQLQHNQEPKMLKQHDDTRWNSAFYMMERMVELKEAVLWTFELAEKDLPELSNDDWTNCAQLCKVFRPFELMTREMSAEKYLTGSSVIIMVRCLKEACRKIIDSSEFSDQVNNVTLLLMSGLNDKFSAVEHDSTLALNTFLDPRFKMQAFSDTNEAVKTKEKVTGLVAETISQNEETAVQTPIKQEFIVDEFNPWDIYDRLIQKNSLTDAPLSKAIKEVDTYLADDILPRKDDPLQWWKNHGHVYPNLLQLFIKYCNVVATSVPCERIFSKSGLVVNQRRTRLSTRKIEQLMFLNVNLDNNRFSNYK